MAKKSKPNRFMSQGEFEALTALPVILRKTRYTNLSTHG